MRIITKKEADKILEKSKYIFTESADKLDYVSGSFNTALLELSQFNTFSNNSTNNLNLNSDNSLLSKIKFPINSLNDGFKKINSAANEVTTISFLKSWMRKTQEIKDKYR